MNMFIVKPTQTTVWARFRPYSSLIRSVARNVIG